MGGAEDVEEGRARGVTGVYVIGEGSSEEGVDV